METCAECGKPILTNEGSYYKNDPFGDFGKTYHSNCGDPFGDKAALARAIADERERCAKIAEDYFPSIIRCEEKQTEEHVRMHVETKWCRAIAAAIRAGGEEQVVKK